MLTSLFHHLFDLSSIRKHTLCNMNQCTHSRQDHTHARTHTHTIIIKQLKQLQRPSSACVQLHFYNNQSHCVLKGRLGVCGNRTAWGPWSSQMSEEGWPDTQAWPWIKGIKCSNLCLQQPHTSTCNAHRELSAWMIRQTWHGLPALWLIEWKTVVRWPGLTLMLCQHPPTCDLTLLFFNS